MEENFDYGPWETTETGNIWEAFEDNFSGEEDELNNPLGI